MENSIDIQQKSNERFLLPSAMVTKDTLTVPGAGGDGSHSPRIGGPGSAFKPYASSENLFDPANFNQRKLSEPAGNNKMVVMTNNNQNYPLANGQGDLTKLTDSRSVTLFISFNLKSKSPMTCTLLFRYFMQRPPPHQGAPVGGPGAPGGLALHHKVRDLRAGKPRVVPFSTTDTEPEMRECNLGGDPRRGKGAKNNKAATYSTSETEEEYQAYLR